MYFGALDQEANDSALISARFVARLRPVKKVAFICDVPGKSRGLFPPTARIPRELGQTLEQAKNSVVLQTPLQGRWFPADPDHVGLHGGQP